MKTYLIVCKKKCEYTGASIGDAIKDYVTAYNEELAIASASNSGYNVLTIEFIG